jgi:hypothetical protein
MKRRKEFRIETDWRYTNMKQMKIIINLIFIAKHLV